MLIRIEGTWLKVESVEANTSLPMLTLEDGTELYVAESTETAGQAAKEYYKDMAENDAEEFSCLVGASTLVAWGLGQWAGPGANQYTCLADWLDGVAEEPEAMFGSQDGTEIDVDDWSEALQTELGFDPGIVYLHNGSLPSYDKSILDSQERDRRVVINVFGGVVQGVFADKPDSLKVTLIDWDRDIGETTPTIQEIDSAEGTGKLADCKVQTVHKFGDMPNSLKEAVAKAR